MDPSRPVPARLTTTLAVSLPEIYGIFGYLGEVLEAITNKSQEEREFLVAVSPRERRTICLAPDERYVLDMDIHQCMRESFMPYVKTSSQDLVLKVEWIQRYDCLL
jgi:hypothetical protein